VTFQTALREASENIIYHNDRRRLEKLGSRKSAEAHTALVQRSPRDTIACPGGRALLFSG
jgi:hypothetical protein